MIVVKSMIGNIASAVVKKVKGKAGKGYIKDWSREKRLEKLYASIADKNTIRKKQHWRDFKEKGEKNAEEEAKNTTNSFVSEKDQKF